MSKCAICKTTWTTQGMTLCPICGARVEGAEIGMKTTRIQRPTQMVGERETKANGTAVLQAPPAPPPAPVIAAEVRKTEPIPVAVAPPPPTPSAAIPAPAPAPAETEEPFIQDSVVLPAPRFAAVETRLPSPARPLSAPLVLGILSLVAVLLLPVTLAFESHRIVGILGFCATGFFVPFAPIAWMAGLGAEKRRREQGLRPESRVVVGRLLGQAGTLLLASEVTVGLILVAGLRLAGNLPATFWVTRHF